MSFRCILDTDNEIIVTYYVSLLHDFTSDSIYYKSR